MNVLIFTPTYEGYAMRAETERSIRAQCEPGVVWEISTFNPHQAPDLRNVYEQYRRGRELALAGGYEALLTVEHDMVLPDGALRRLMETPAGVVYGAYILRHGARVSNLWRYEGDVNLGQSLTLYPAELARLRDAQAPVRVSGVGFGCTLIRREVLERLEFRPDDNGGAPDVPFARDCLAAGVVAMGRLDVGCDHFDGDVRIGADEDMMKAAEVLALKNVTVQNGEDSVRLVAGQRYSLRSDVAGELVRAGYVQMVMPAMAVEMRNAYCGLRIETPEDGLPVLERRVNVP